MISQINEVEHESQMLKKELEANKEAYFDMRDREKSFKQKIKEERRELKQDREKLTKLLIENKNKSRMK